MLLLAVAGAGCAATAGRGTPPPHPPPPPSTGAREGFRFVDVAAAAGLDRVVHAGRPGKDHLLDSAGTGAAWIDYDGDGLLDLYIVNGWLLDGATVIDRGSNALYRNRGDGTFEDITTRAGVSGDGAWGSGVAVADYDTDGRPDLLVTNFGSVRLYRNRGDGTFEDVTAATGLVAPGWNTGAAFLDAEGDGALDLYVAAYIQATLDDVLSARRTLDWKGEEKVAFGPFGLTGDADRFFRADGHGRFHEATVEAGLTDRGLGYGFGVRAVDIDDDGDLDLYVANDSDANYLYRNEGDGTFTDVGLWSGAAYDAHGAAQAGMGVAAEDVTGDGKVDLFVTNFSEDFSTLYRGDGIGFFEDISDRTGVGAATWSALSWGTALVDLDNDGDRDIVIANGHIYPQVDAHPEYGLSYRQANMLLENRDGSFVDVTALAGPGFAVLEASRGLAVGDYDNDGDLDLLFTNLDAPPTLLRNDSAGGSWITVVCDGNGAGVIGARVVVTAGGRTQRGDVASGDSLMSSHDPRVHFGLGDTALVDSVEVTWPDGTRSRLEGVEVDRFLTVRREGSGKASLSPE